jgi:DNA-directed RNA polymerase specialized sigma24 family protein
MDSNAAFRDLVRRVRAGDQQAAAALVRQFEPETRRYIRLRLTDPGLHRLLDSVDIFQSVLAIFFVRLRAGQFQLDQPEQLAKLLVRMVRNKIVDYARKPASRRDRDGGPELWDRLVVRGQSPSDIVTAAELLGEVRRRLTEEERSLAEQRAEGRSWQEIAAACQGRPDALRKKLERALDRVCGELGGHE